MTIAIGTLGFMTGESFPAYRIGEAGCRGWSFSTPARGRRGCKLGGVYDVL